MILLNPKTRRKIEIISTLGGIWFIVSLPLPWIIGDPNVGTEPLIVVFQMNGYISSPFVGMAVARRLNPELSQKS